jgi:hypothetical protein
LYALKHISAMYLGLYLSSFRRLLFERAGSEVASPCV